MKKLFIIIIVLAIMVGYLATHQIKISWTQPITVEEYINHCAESKQYQLASILCNYQAATVIGCEHDLAEMIGQYMQLKIKQVKKGDLWESYL